MNFVKHLVICVVTICSISMMMSQKVWADTSRARGLYENAILLYQESEDSYLKGISQDKINDHLHEMDYVVDIIAECKLLMSLDSLVSLRNNFFLGTMVHNVSGKKYAFDFYETQSTLGDAQSANIAAILMMENSDYDKALDLFQRSVELSRHNVYVPAFYNAAYIYAVYATQETDSALRDEMMKQARSALNQYITITDSMWNPEDPSSVLPYSASEYLCTDEITTLDGLRELQKATFLKNLILGKE